MRRRYSFCLRYQCHLLDYSSWLCSMMRRWLFCPVNSCLSKYKRLRWDETKMLSWKEAHMLSWAVNNRIICALEREDVRWGFEVSYSLIVFQCLPPSSMLKLSLMWFGAWIRSSSACGAAYCTHLNPIYIRKSATILLQHSPALYWLHIPKSCFKQ